MSVIIDGTAGVSDVDGTAASPAFRGTDTNTGMFFPATDTIAFSEGGVEAMRLDSAGNVGIGTSSPTTKLTVSGGLAVQGTVGSFPTSGQGWEISGESATACAMQAYNRNASSWLDAKWYAGTHIWLTNGSERARIDSSGNLSVGGIGSGGSKVTSTVNFGSNWTGNFVARALGTAQGQLAGYSFNTTFQNTGDNGPRRSADIWSGYNGGAWGTEFLAFGVGGAGDPGNITTERMRIDGGGNLLVGTTATINVASSNVAGCQVAGYGTVIASANNTTAGFFKRYTATGNILEFYYGTSSVGYISTNGSTVTFSGNALSDARWKENIQPIENALGTVCALDFVRFNYKSDGRASAGVTAQQMQAVEAVAPFVTNGESDSDYKAVDYNALIGFLGKAIQELKTQNDELRARVAALEGAK